jgi:WD40 repeat protein
MVCKHLVCPTCAADWATCTEPSGRTFRMGMTARLIDVDPSGRLGLVQRWKGPLKLVDLRGLRWIEEPGLTHAGNKDLRPRLTSEGCLFRAEFQSAVTNDVPYFIGLSMTTIGVDERIILKELPAPSRSTGVTAQGDRFYYVTGTELVAIVERFASRMELSVQVFEPLPKKVVQAVHVDATRDVIAAGTWGEIAIQRIVDGRLVLAGHTKTTGDTVWLQIAGDYLAAHVRTGAHRGITVWRLYPDLSIGSEVLHIADRVECAALSSDGRYFAVGIDGDHVLIRDLATGAVEELDGHTDTISFVRFVGDDHVLVSADDDNRVILRPRGQKGYPQAVLPIELATSG